MLQKYYNSTCEHKSFTCAPAVTLHSHVNLHANVPSLSTRIDPVRFQARGCRKRPNLGLVFIVYFVLSVFLS